jgi:hypothetical protein
VSTDLTTSWTISTTENAQFIAEHIQSTGQTFTKVQGQITVTSSLCQLGVDHLVLLVEAESANGINECLVYNNYYTLPILCGGGDSVDVRLALDRQNKPIFELIGDKVFVLGTEKSFSLKVDIDVKGL